MVIIGSFIIGAIWGVVHQRRRGGSGLDMAQYGAVWALIGAIIGMFATIGLERML